MRHTDLKHQRVYLGLATLGVLGLHLLGQLTTAQADGSFRCKTSLVSTGAAAYEVRSKCGTPDDMQTRAEVRTVRRAVSVPCATGICQSFVEDSYTVNVEEWIYDFGPQRFLQFLTFEQGKLLQIRSGGYGKKIVSEE